MSFLTWLPICPVFGFQQSMRENKEKQALSDLMIKPVQRIPRYELLVKVSKGLGGQAGKAQGPVGMQRALRLGPQWSSRKGSPLWHLPIVLPAPELVWGPRAWEGQLSRQIWPLFPPQDLLKHTPEDHPDHPLLLDAQRNIKEVAERINKGVRSAEEAERHARVLQEIEAHIEGMEDVREAPFHPAPSTPVSICGDLELWSCPHPQWCPQCLSTSIFTFLCP